MEAPDGRATADWIAEQPWFNGSLGTFGASYMGFTQWALASTRPPHLKAMVVALAASVRAFSWYPGGSLALEVIIPWDLGATQFNKEPNANTIADVSPEAIQQRMAELRAGFDHLPLGDVIRHLTGADLELYQDQLAHAGLEDPFWSPLDYSALLPDGRCPRCWSTAGTTIRCRGCSRTMPPCARRPRRSGCASAPGGHLGGGGEGGMTDAPLAWFDTYLRGEDGLLPHRPVTIEVQGRGRWLARAR
jgi:hypothetical protein